MPEKEYQRLTRARSRSAISIAFTSRSSLWLGKDHLLCVDSGGYTETYKRFYFRDIQVISIERTDRHHWWSAILGSLAFIFFIIALGVAPGNPFAQWSDGAIAGVTFLSTVILFCILLLLINLLSGPACKCFLRTAVQIEELPSLNRVRRARKGLERLRPFLIAVQGELTPEEISARMRTAAGSPAGAAMSPKVSAPPTPAVDNPEALPIIS